MIGYKSVIRSGSLDHSQINKVSWLRLNYSRRRQSRGTVFTSVCLRVCLLLHDIAKTDAAKITNFDIEMFQDESWNPIYFGISRSKVKVTSRRKIPGVGLCILVSADFFRLIS